MLSKKYLFLLINTMAYYCFKRKVAKFSILICFVRRRKIKDFQQVSILGTAILSEIKSLRLKQRPYNKNLRLCDFQPKISRWIIIKKARFSRALKKVFILTD